MKSLVVYADGIGNTQKVAWAVYEILPLPKAMYPVEDAPHPGAFDFVALGFRMAGNSFDAKIREYMTSVKGKDVGLFVLSDFEPYGLRAQQWRLKLMKMVSDNRFHGIFMCRNKKESKWKRTGA